MRELERRVVLSVLDRKWREHLYEMDYLREGIGLRAMAQRDPLIEYQREGYDLFTTMMEGIKEESIGSLFNLQVEVQQNPIVEDATAPPAPGLGVRAGRAPAAGAAQPGIAGQAERASQAGTTGATPNGPAPAGQRAGSRRGAAAQASRSQGGRRTADGGPDAAAQDTAVAPGVVAPGLARPKRPSRLSYSAPTVDGGDGGGDGHVQRRTESSGGAAQNAKVGRNDLCPCGSGRKYKRCHGDPRNRAE
jgi:preprotein translocase subunit SecA